MASQQLVGRNVRRLRVARGLSQEELAFRADVQPTYVSKLERGVMNVTIQTLDAVAKALGVKTIMFFDEVPLPKDAAKGLRAGRKPMERPKKSAR